MASGIYKITCSVNGKLYIGSAVDLAKRWTKHRSKLQLKQHHSPKLQAAWNKYGADAFVFEVLEQVHSHSELIATEQRWLDAVKPHVVGFNVCPVAGSTLGKRHSEEAKRKMAEARYGKRRRRLPEEIERIAAANRGKKRSAEHIEHMRRVMTGKQLSGATRAKMAASHKGKELSAKTRAKLSDVQRESWTPERHAAHLARMAQRQPASEETRARMSEAAKKRAQRGISDETRAKMAENTRRRNLERGRLARAAAESA